MVEEVFQLSRSDEKAIERVVGKNETERTVYVPLEHGFISEEAFEYISDQKMDTLI